MSESMSTPWIHNYFIGIAETYGAQPYNAPVTKAKRRVQLTDLLTYQENSYVWAWVSDKDHRISIRISKDATDEYKRRHGRSIIDSRFFVVFVGNYRPMFSPRPLGSTARGNTSVSHISLEIGHISSVGMGGHLFGNPRDLESDEKIKEWVLGLRQDGGGGNVLKLRKQQEQAQNKKLPPSPPPPPPFSLYAPLSQRPPTRDAEDDAESKLERPHNFKRAFAKCWRKISPDPLAYLTRSGMEKRQMTESSDSLAEPHSESTVRLESREPSAPPASASASPLRRQGTPTDWSPSYRGSSVALDIFPTTSHSSSDTERHKADNAITLDDDPPPTSAQRVKCSPLPCSSPPPNSSPICSQLPRSSPPPPSLSTAHYPPSSFPAPAEVWKNVQRKIPHPGLPVPRPDSTNQSPARILVPNSDTSGSQSYTCLSKEFQPADESTPKDGNEVGRKSKTYAEILRVHNNKQEAPLSGDSPDNASVDKGKQKECGPTRPPAQNAQKVEVLEVGTSDTEDEADILRLTNSNALVEARIATLSKTQDASERGVNADREDSQLSIDDADIHLVLQGIPPRHSPPPVPTPANQHTANVSVQPLTPSPTSPERPESRGSMDSLFSASLEEEQSVASQLLVSSVGRKEDDTSPCCVPRHDAEGWKEPSFISKHKGKGKVHAIEEPETPSTTAGKKRRRSTEAELPLQKRAKHPRNGCRDALGQTIVDQAVETSARGESHLRNRPSSPSRDTGMAVPPLVARLSRPRLANFVVDFEAIDLGKGVPIPRLDLERDIKGTLLRTGRIRTQGERVEKDGSIYIHS